jgi:invasion protein IalB
LQIAYNVCVPAACMIRDDVIRKLRAATEQGKLMFKDANQRDVSLPVSFKGFNPAYEALSKE